MSRRITTLLYWSLGFIFSCLFIWAVAAVFKNSVSARLWDEAVGRYVHDPSAEIRIRDEGWADSTAAKHGLTPEGEVIFESPAPKFLFWGDSFAEGFQVREEDRAIALYNHLAGPGKVKGVAVAESGLSMADFYFFIPRYESLTRNVVGHVFLLAGMRSVTPGQHLDCHSRFLPDPWRFELSDCPPSDVALKYAISLNQMHADFLHSIYKSLATYDFRFSVGNLDAAEPVVSKVEGSLDLAGLEEGWRFMLQELKKQSSVPLTFVYIPLRPALSRGDILMGDPDVREKDRFAAICGQEGVEFLDLTKDFVAAYERNGKLAQGFFNTPQGIGHLNAGGQAVIAEGLYQYFKGTGL